MRAAIGFAVLALVAGCGNAHSDRQHIELAELGYDMPGNWGHKDTSHRGLATSVWAPEENDDKESIVVIRTKRSPAVAMAGTETLEHLLLSAHRSLQGARISTIQAVKTARGLSGFRIETDFMPAGLHVSYHRVHVLLIVREALVHILYTAHKPDGHQVALNMVLESIHHGEG